MAEILDTDIAIVGMALRVPGARDLETFWSNLVGGVESIRTLTDEELLAAGESPARLARPNYVRSAAPLEDMAMFDAEYFGFSPKEAAIVDPQHRQFLECTVEALEAAAHPPGQFPGRVGIFGGCGQGSYLYYNLCTNPDLLDSVGMFLLRHTGNDKDFLVTRVAYLLDLRGPAINVQTACSTSLVATHLACQSLIGFECDMAIAGGATVEIPHGRGYLYQEGEILSPDGHCHAFDHRAQGTVFGSGAGVVVLRRLADAIEDGDHIHAVIKGSAINNDGGSKVGYLAPSVDGQANVMAEAYEIAEIDPATIGYVECHGTGTYMGDPIEIEALTQAFRRSTERTGFCRVASVKSNIGHLDTAAGVVSLIKAALSVERGQMPPSISFEAPNPHIDFASTPFVVADALHPWPSGAVRRAAVNSLGVGGTNAHLVLQQPPEPPVSTQVDRPALITTSARTVKALDELGDRLADHLQAHPELSLTDVAYTLQVGRAAHSQRRVLACRDLDEAASLLRSRDPRRVFTHSHPGEGASAVFMFPGGGSQYPSMAADLYRTDEAFRADVDRGLSILDETHPELDLRGLLFDPADPEDAARRFEKTSVQLPAIFIIEHALAQAWMARGVTPRALIGHSLGENTAACLAGVMRYADALGLVALRGALLDQAVPGAMLSVPLSAAAVEARLGSDLDLAIVNADELCVVSGPAEAVDALAAALAEEGVEARRLHIAIAAHSRGLDPVLETFAAYLRSVELSAPQIPIVSNRTGTWLDASMAQSPDYWVEQLRHTVRFGEGLQTLLEEEGRVFVEVGPGHTLGALVRIQTGAARAVAVLGSLRHPEEDVADDVFFAAQVGRAWAAGASDDLSWSWDGAAPRRRILPAYPWQHRRYFVEPQGPRGDVGVERIDDVSAQLFRAIWSEVPAPRPEDRRTSWLVFADELGVADAVAHRWRAQGHAVVLVRAGDSFHRRSEHEYTLSPERGREGYDALLRELVAAGHAPQRILHTWLVTSGDAFRPGSSSFHQNMERGFYSLFFLGQALQDSDVPAPLELVTVTSSARSVAGSRVVSPDKALVQGPAMVIPRELEGVTCKLVDVVVPEPSALAGLKQLVGRAEERLAPIADALAVEGMGPAGDAQVAYRDGRRYVLGFLQDKLRKGDRPLVQGTGAYLITGGLGGLGLTVAEVIAESGPVKLLLVSRSEPSPPAMARIEALRRQGAEVVVVAADVTDIEAMRGARDQARARWGRVAGVVHAAGIVDDALLSMKTQMDVERVFTPKVHGTLVLDELLDVEALDFMYLFSSTSTVIAPPGQVDYVAANAFLEAYAASKTNPEVKTIGWGVWSDVGMAARAIASEDAGVGDLRQVEDAPAPWTGLRAIDGRGRVVFETTLAPSTHWMLDEHRTQGGQAVLPGTGVVALFDAALVALESERGWVFRDVYFLTPLHVADDEPRRVRVRLQRSESGYQLELRSLREVRGRDAWELHAQADVDLSASEVMSTQVDIVSAKRRCEHAHRGDDRGLEIAQEAFLDFGPRWRSLRAEGRGEAEAFASLRLGDDFVEDLTATRLHPALLDVATGFALDLAPGHRGGEALWVPVSYRSIAVHAPLPRVLVSWVRSRGDGGEGFAWFDVSIATPDGELVVEVEGLSMKRLDGELTLGATREPSRFGLEYDAGAPGQSPAEASLRRNVERGLRVHEGKEALRRLLSAPGGEDHLMITSIPLASAVQEVDAMVSARGDSSASFERPELDSDYVEPRDDVERTLVSFWTELLGVQRVGVRDSFFDLGGHSLVAVRLFSMVKKAFNVEFPISILFEAPTIEACARLISEAMTDAPAVGAPASEPTRRRYTHLVAMHEGEGGRGRPFFLVAGMFGNVLNLRHLAQLLSVNRPFYGLQARGLYGEETPHRTFEEMARDYLEELRSVQPHGPYLLGGFSGGGITAFEMARQLRADGEEVAALVLLDTPIAGFPTIDRRDRARVHAIKLRSMGPMYLTQWAGARLDWELRQLKERHGAPPPQAPEAFHDRAIEAAFRGALDQYEMRPYSGPVTLFRPRLDRAYVLGPDRVLSSDLALVFADNLWGRYVDDLEVHEVPGDHDSMVLEPNVRVLASRLGACIARAERRVAARTASPAQEGAEPPLMNRGLT